MAVIHAYRALNMLNTDVWYGAVTKYNSSTIEITAGNVVARYTGSFTYDAYGNVFGQLQGYTVLVNGSVSGSVTGFSIDAYRFSQELYDGDVYAIYNMILSGADQFYGSNSGDKMLGLGGSDRMEGSGGNDNLFGGKGSDKLYAGTGSDKLIGEAGKDRLHGGTDSAGDVFIFNSRYDSRMDARDVVFNFTRGSDDIDLRGIDAWGGTYANEAFQWSGRTAADHSVWWKDTDRGVVLRGDVNGDAKADFQILIANIHFFGSGDVLL